MRRPKAKTGAKRTDGGKMGRGFTDPVGGFAHALPFSRSRPFCLAVFRVRRLVFVPCVASTVPVPFPTPFPLLLPSLRAPCLRDLQRACGPTEDKRGRAEIRERLGKIAW